MTTKGTSMHRLLLTATLLSATAGQSLLWAQPIFPEPLSPRIANYSIDVTLDTKEKSLNGREVLVWTNTSGDRVTELQFHLYLNAFRDNQSTFMKESGGVNRGISAASGEWGWIDVTSMRTSSGVDLLPGAMWISPDDGNADDRTVLRVSLPEPLRPGKSIELAIEFTSRLPRVFARTGFAGDFYMVGQWFPKIGVYEAKGVRGRTQGGWNCHQFHSNSEFYADYGVYDVRMTVPAKFVLGATGLLRGTTTNGDGTVTHSYHAEDVHDFAWTCSPVYQSFERQWRHVNIRLLLQPEHVSGNKERYFQSVEAALEYFDGWVGAYPYPNVTVVDPPIYAMGAGGMEYPTLITGGSLRFAPKGFLPAPEGVTVHEFGHQYWYGLVGSNEFEEAWMDEGFNQYSETRIMDHAYGPATSGLSLAGYEAGDGELARSGFIGLDNPKISPIDQPAWAYTAGGYGGMTYAKTATWMITLERLIGRPVMDEAMRTYFERWRFRHPSREDFIAVVDEVVRKRHGTKFGASLDWYFRQMLDGTETCDYALTSIEVRDTPRPRGRGITSSEPARSGAQFTSTVLVSRLGEVMMPVEVAVTFDDGKTVTEQWDGKERYKLFKYTDARKVTSAAVDPREVLWIDANRLNNARSTEVGSAVFVKYALKFMFWLQNVAQYAAVL